MTVKLLFGEIFPSVGDGDERGKRTRDLAMLSQRNQMATGGDSRWIILITGVYSS
jgi:hypothetical protein